MVRNIKIKQICLMRNAVLFVTMSGCGVALQVYETMNQGCIAPLSVY
jgi:hypothetical protein